MSLNCRVFAAAVLARNLTTLDHCSDVEWAKRPRTPRSFRCARGTTTNFIPWANYRGRLSTGVQEDLVALVRSLNRHRCWIMPLAAAMRRCDLPKALELTAAIICIFSWAFWKSTMAEVRISTSLGSRSSCMALISHRHPAYVNPLEHGLPRLPGANTAACPRRLTTFEINTPRSATDQANPSSS